MVQQSSSLHNFSTDVDHHVISFPAQLTAELPTRSESHIPIEVPARSGSRAVADRQAGVRTLDIRGVVVLEVAGRLSDVVQDLSWAIQLALAEAPRGVVCDLSAVLEGAEPGAVQMLATAGRYVRDWSGIPVAVACPDLRVREALAAHPLGGHLIVTDSIFSAVSSVLAAPTLAVAWLRLPPHPTAPRAACEFVTHTLQDWGLAPLILAADLVVSELVTSSTMHATSDIELSVAWNQGALRLTVRDNSPDVPRQRYTHFDLYGSRLTAAAGISRAFGVLPTAEGGKVVWAVLNAARPRPSTNRRSPGQAATLREAPIFTEAPRPGRAVTLRCLSSLPT